jgi:hypothetical protein
MGAALTPCKKKQLLKNTNVTIELEATIFAATFWFIAVLIGRALNPDTVKHAFAAIAVDIRNLTVFPSCSNHPGMFAVIAEVVPPDTAWKSSHNPRWSGLHLVQSDAVELRRALTHIWKGTLGSVCIT